MISLAVLYLIGYLTTVIVMNYNMYRDTSEWTLLGIVMWMVIALAFWWFIAVVWSWIQADKMIVYARKG
jgi:hypothetical protein